MRELEDVAGRDASGLEDECGGLEVVAGGDPESFARLCVPLRSELLAHAKRFTKNLAAAEDVVQDAYVKAFRLWGGFAPPDGVDEELAVRRWMFRVVTNMFYNHVESRRSRERIVHDYWQDPISPRSPCGTRRVANIGGSTHAFLSHRPDRSDIRDLRTPDPLEKFSDEVVEALAHVDADQREVVVMRAEGAEYPDIAQVAGIPKNTVGTRIHRARAVLAPLLAEYAWREYRIGAPLHAAGERPAQPAQVVQAEPDRVDRVVGGLDAEALGLAEATADQRAAG